MAKQRNQHRPKPQPKGKSNNHPSNPSAHVGNIKETCIALGAIGALFLTSYTLIHVFWLKIVFLVTSLLIVAAIYLIWRNRIAAIICMVSAVLFTGINLFLLNPMQSQNTVTTSPDSHEIATTSTPIPSSIPAPSKPNTDAEPESGLSSIPDTDTSPPIPDLSSGKEITKASYDALPQLLESDFQKEVLNATKPVLVFFCRYPKDGCDAMLPHVISFAHENTGRVKVVMVDVMVNSILAKKYNAGYSEAPVLALFKDGSEQGRITGAASKQAILQLLEKPSDFKAPKTESPVSRPERPPSQAAILAEIPNVLESDFEDKILKSTLPALVYFYADSRDACKITSPTVAEIAEIYKGRIAVFRVDAYINDNIPRAYKAGYFQTPVLIMFKKGTEQRRLVGTASKEAITRMIDNVLAAQ